MVEFTYITPEFAIGPQISAEDISQLSADGFKSILNARPDDEIGSYMLAEEAERLASQSGLGYVHAPTEGHEIFETDVIDRFERALAELPTPIFSHCKTGTRSAMLWALVAARHREVEDVISTLNDAGQEFDFLEQELRDSAADAKKSPLRLKEDALMNLGTSGLLGEDDPN